MKKLLLVAFVALFASSFISCQKEPIETLYGTTWKASDVKEGQFNGQPTSVTTEVTIKFNEEAQGSLDVHYTSLVGETVMQDDKVSYETTYTFDGKSGCITTLPKEGQEKQSIMFKQQDENTITLTMKYAALEYDLTFNKQ